MHLESSQAPTERFDEPGETQRMALEQSTDSVKGIKSGKSRQQVYSQVSDSSK